MSFFQHNSTSVPTLLPLMWLFLANQKKRKMKTEILYCKKNLGSAKKKSTEKCSKPEHDLKICFCVWPNWGSWISLSVDPIVDVFNGHQMILISILKESRFFFFCDHSLKVKEVKNAKKFSLSLDFPNSVKFLHHCKLVINF